MTASPRRAKRRQKQKERGSEEDFTKRLVTLLYPNSPASEAYRTLRTNLLFALVDNPPKVTVVTSPGPGEGKSTTCTNLGVVLAQAAKSVLIIDCDLRKPVVHKFFELPNLYGIVDVLVGERRIQEVWKEPVDGLKVISVGSIPPNPSELVGTRRFSELVASVRREFDYVLLDASPIGLVSDPAILAIQGDAVLLAVDAQNTRKDSVRQAVHDLEAVGANILGTVMNKVTASNSKYRYGYTYEEY